MSFANFFRVLCPFSGSETRSPRAHKTRRSPRTTLQLPSRFDRSRDRNRSRLALETLKEQRLLTLGPEFGGSVNVPTLNDNFVEGASTPEGSYVVVWDQETTPTTYEVMRSGSPASASRKLARRSR